MQSKALTFVRPGFFFFITLVPLPSHAQVNHLADIAAEVNRHVAGKRVAPAMQQITQMSTYGPYALVLWTCGHSGGTLLLSNAGGSYTTIFGGGGVPKAGELASMSGISMKAASSLLARLARIRAPVRH